MLRALLIGVRSALERELMVSITRGEIMTDEFMAGICFEFESCRE